MKKIICILIISLSVCFFATSGYSATYYIDYKDGNDSNDGTSIEMPFKHLPFDSRFTGSYSGSNGDDFYFKRGVAYNAGTSQSGTLFSLRIAGTLENRTVFGAYGTGTKPVITGGQAIDYSQFTLLNGTTNVYRATKASLGISTPTITGVFEAGNYDNFNPRHDNYTRHSSTANMAARNPCGFFDDGTYLYIRTADDVAPNASMDLHVSWMEDGFISTAVGFFTFENLILQGFTGSGTPHAIYCSGSSSHSGYGLILDNCRIQFCTDSSGNSAAVYMPNTAVWVKDTDFYYLSYVTDSASSATISGGALTASTSNDTPTLIERSEFKRPGRNPISLTGSSNLRTIIRRCFMMDLPYYLCESGTGCVEELQHFITGRGANSLWRLSRNIIYAVGSDFFFDYTSPVSIASLQIWNNTIVDEGHPTARSGFGNQTVDAVVDYRNNVVVERHPIASYGGGGGNIDTLNSTVDHNYIQGRDWEWLVVLDAGASRTETNDIGTWRIRTAAEGKEFDTNSATSLNSNYSDTFISVTYGDEDFLKPKSDGPLIDAGTAINDGENETDFSGNTVTGTFDIGAYEYQQSGQPQASFNVLPLSGDAPLTCQFNESSNDTDGFIISWNWDFGDGEISNEQNPTHIYTSPGNYTARLTVMDNDGLSNSTTASISVSSADTNQQPQVSFYVSPVSGNAPLICQFSQASNDTDGSIVSWDWNFGDGVTSSEENPTHTYMNAGNYIATLTVTDDGGLSSSISTEITVISADSIKFYIQTEQGSLSSPMLVGSEDIPESAGSYIYVPSGAGVTTNPSAEAVYEINIPYTGIYYLWIKMYGPSTENDAIYIGFNDYFDRVYSSQWSDYEWLRVERSNNSENYAHELSQGENQIIIGHGEELVRVDAIFVTDDPNLIPSAATLPLDQVINVRIVGQ